MDYGVCSNLWPDQTTNKQINKGKDLEIMLRLLSLHKIKY